MFMGRMTDHTATSSLRAPKRPSSASSDCSGQSASPGPYGYASSHGDHPEPFVLSGPNTPEPRPEPRASPVSYPDNRREMKAVPRSVGSEPIAIEMPILPRKPKSGAEATPPAPLSARGDVIGCVIRIPFR